MQSSGFLDLKSLMSLSRTCKAHAYDGLSLIMFIENELTRCHKCHTTQEALDYLKSLYEKKYLPLKQWFERDGKHSIRVSRRMAELAVRRAFVVMFVKMLRTVLESERLKFVSQQDLLGMNLLHRAARSGNIEIIKAILAVYPESDYLSVVNLKDEFRGTVLHHVTESGNRESLQFCQFIQNQRNNCRL